MPYYGGRNGLAKRFNHLLLEARGRGGVGISVFLDSVMFKTYGIFVDPREAKDAYIAVMATSVECCERRRLFTAVYSSSVLCIKIL